MSSDAIDAFPPEVIDKLKTYVYRLIDPRNGETFYVGKGKGNRVFAHARNELGSDGDELDDKLARIRKIRVAGFEANHVIHRHGLDDKTAFAVESALIDAYPGLTNEAGGQGGNEFGAMHAGEIIRKYSAETVVFRHNAMLISINRSADSQPSLYEATRFSWKVSRANAEKAEIILAVVRGLIQDAFIAEEWLEATSGNFPGRPDIPGRLGFNGRKASDSIRKYYIGKRIPEEFRRQGASNPIKYAKKTTTLK